MNFEYKVDNLIINKIVIQSCLKESQTFQKNKDSRFHTFSAVFKLCSNLKKFEQNKFDKILKQQIKQSIDSNLQKQTSNRYQKQSQKLKQFKLDPQRVYYLNKPGNFGRILQRKCRIVPKGLMQYQDNKESKLKQIKSFVNKVEFVQSIDNESQLPWISSMPPNQCPKFRIILLDANNNKKTIYFNDYQQAEKARAYFCSRYKKNNIDGQILSKLKYQLLENICQNFTQKIHQFILYKKAQKPKKLFAQDELQQTNKNRPIANDSPLRRSKMNIKQFQTVQVSLQKTNKMMSSQKGAQSSLIISQKRIKKQKLNSSGFLDDLIDQRNERKKNIFSRLNQTKVQNQSNFQQNNVSKSKNLISPFIQLDNLYIKSFFLGWKDLVNSKGKRPVVNNVTDSRFISSNNELVNSKTQNFTSKDQSFLRFGDGHLSSKKQKQILYLTNQNQEVSSVFNFSRQKMYTKDIQLNDQQNRYYKLESLNKSNAKSHVNFQQKSPSISPEKGALSPSKTINDRMSHSKKQQSIFPLNKITKKTIDQENSSTESVKNLQKNTNIMQKSKNNMQKSLNNEQKSEIDIQKLSKKLGTEKITFKSIQFLKLNQLIKRSVEQKNKQDLQNSRHNQQNSKKNESLLFKPIINISLIKNALQDPKNFKERSVRSRIQQNNTKSIYQCVFNTLIKKVDPNFQYELSPTDEKKQSVFETTENLSNFTLIISVINYLTNQEILQTKCYFKNVCMSSTKQNIIVDTSQMIKLRLYYKNTGTINRQSLFQQSQSMSSSLLVQFPRINPQIIQKIKNYWESSAVSNSYYNLEDNFNLFDAVTNSSNEAQPLSWWVDLDELQYNYLCILQSSSVILGFKLVKPMLYLIRAITKLKNLNIQKTIQIILSVIINLGKWYYFVPQLTKTNELHKQIGLTTTQIQFENKILFQKLLFQKMLIMECNDLQIQLAYKNIHLPYLLLEYVYQLFSRNLQTQVLFQFWNYCYLDLDKSPLILFLLSIVICKVLKQKLMVCRRFSEVRQVFQSKNQIKSARFLITEIKSLRTKYFFKGEGFIQQIKYAFLEKPFEHFLAYYYRRLQQQQSQKIKNQQNIKQQICLNALQSVSFDQIVGDIYTNEQKMKNKKYNVHLYFYQLPQISGKFVLVSGKSQYQSLSTDKSRYFIIGQISSSVFIKFTDFNGNIYMGQLKFNQGFNQFKTKLKCDNLMDIQVHYLGGLLTQSQIQTIKNNKKSDHFYGSSIQKSYFQDQFLKPIKQSKLLSNSISRLDSQEKWIRQLKGIFGYGSKQFNEMDYFIHLLLVQQRSLQQKIAQVYTFSQVISKQVYLCSNEIIFKQLIHKFMRLAFPSISYQQFQCYFNDSLTYQFDAPKIIKCRFQLANNKSIKLEKQLAKYLAQKNYNYLYGDLFIDEILQVCQPYIKEKLGVNFGQGEIKILYSSFGKVSLKIIPLKIQNRQIIIDYTRLIQNSSIKDQISQKEPQILMTQVLPSFTKISTILNFVNTDRTIDMRAKLANQQQHRLIPQNLNLLKTVQQKLRSCLILRYSAYPRHLAFPFIQYFTQLSKDVQTPINFRHFYLNNIKQSIKSVCLCKQDLRFNTNNKEKDFSFDKSLGLYGNLRKLLQNGLLSSNNLSSEKGFVNTANSVFFWTSPHQDQNYPSSLLYVDYGYGVYRWQKCLIKKYKKSAKQRINRKRQASQAKQKNEYLVEHNNEKYFATQYQVKLNPLVKPLLQEIAQRDKQSQIDSDIKSGLSFLLNISNLNKLVAMKNSKIN